MGTGYVRNDTANNIAGGNVIDAADLDGEFDAIVTAFSTSGHTHDGTAAEGGPVTVLGPAQEYVGDGTSLSPKTDDTYDLGTSLLQWKDIYINGIGYIDTLDLAGTQVTSIDTDLSSVSASDDTLASAKAIKTYVDAQVTAQDLDFQCDSGGALSIDLDSETMTFTGGTGIDTTGSANDVTIAIDNTVATLTGSQTLTNKVLTAPTIATITNTGTITLPTATTTLVGRDTTDTLTNKTLTTPTLTLKQGTSPAPTAEGDIQWDTDDNQIKVGDGASTKTFSDDSKVALVANNLSDLDSASTARTNLGLTIGTNVQAYDAVLADLAGLTLTQGDVLYYDGANLQNLGIGSAGQVLKVNSGATAPEWSAPTRIGYNQTTTYATLSTAMPYDDTIPQSTEGDEVLTVSFTPVSASSYLLIRAVVQVYSPSNTHVTGALFVDSATSAFAANSIFTSYSGGAVEQDAQLVVEAIISAGSTSARTYKIRCGANSGSAYVNGNSSGRRLGGVATTTLSVTELAA